MTGQSHIASIIVKQDAASGFAFMAENWRNHRGSPDHGLVDADALTLRKISLAIEISLHHFRILFI